MSCHLSLSSASVCLILLVCLALRFSEGLPFSYLVFLSIFIVVFIHHSISFASFIYLCICTYLRPFNPSIQLFIFRNPSISPSISSISQRYIYIYLFIYPLKRNHVFSHLSRVSLSLSLFVSRCWNIQRFVEIRYPSAMQQAPFCTSRLEQMSHEVNRMKRYHWHVKCIYG